MRALVLAGGPWWTSRRAPSDSRPIAEPIPWRLSACCRRCCRGSIYRAPCCAAATWRPPPPWNSPACRSMCRRSDLLREHWTEIQDDLIAGDRRRLWRLRGRTFQGGPVGASYLAAHRHSVAADLRAAGSTLSDDTFRQMAKAHPAVSPMRELRSALSEIAPERSGRRSRWPQSDNLVGVPLPHRAESAEQYSVYLRPERLAARADQAAAAATASPTSTGLNRNSASPPPCPAIAAMQAAYRSGDPYLAFAKQAGAVPPDATKQTSRPRRASCSRQCVLGVQYGMEADSLAVPHRPAADCRSRSAAGASRDLPRILALVGRRRRLSRCCTGSLHTVFGWHVHVGENPQPALTAKFSRCRRTAPRCCGWPAAWRPSAASRSARRCTTRS